MRIKMSYTTTAQKIWYISGHRLIYEDPGFYLISKHEICRKRKITTLYTYFKHIDALQVRGRGMVCEWNRTDFITFTVKSIQHFIVRNQNLDVSQGRKTQSSVCSSPIFCRRDMLILNPRARNFGGKQTIDFTLMYKRSYLGPNEMLRAGKD